MRPSSLGEFGRLNPSPAAMQSFLDKLLLDAGRTDTTTEGLVCQKNGSVTSCCLDSGCCLHCGSIWCSLTNC